MKKYLLILTLPFFFLPSLIAQYNDFNKEDPTAPYLNTITNAAPFLLISPDSRAGGMGDMGVSTSPDNYCQHHNPAKYIFNKDIFGIGIAYSPWLSGLVNDITLAYLSTFWKVTDNDAIAASLRFFSFGEITFTKEDGVKITDVSPNEFALDFTYARKLSKIVSMAVTPRFMYSNLTQGYYDPRQGIDMKAGIAGAVDISLFVDKTFIHYRSSIKSSRLMFGANISNIGNKVSYTVGNTQRDFLPCNLRLGLSYELNLDDYNRIGVNVEVGKLLVPTPPVGEKDTALNIWKYYGNGKDLNKINPIEGIARSFYDAAGGYKWNSRGCFNEEMREVIWSFGIEYSYRDILFVRTGTFLESQYKGNRKFATVGAGIKYNIFAIDVSYLFTLTNQHHPLENTLRFTLTFMLESFNKDRIKTQKRFN